MMLFFMHWMTIGIPFMDKFCRGLYLWHTWNTTWHSPICQPSVVVGLFTYFSWVPAVIWTVWNNPQLEALFEPEILFFFFQIPRPSVCLTLKIFKYPEPAVLWLWPFSKTQNPWWFFDSGNFQISITDGSLILKVLKYPNTDGSLILKVLKWALKIDGYHPKNQISTPTLASICNIKSTSGNPCCTLELALIEPVTTIFGFFSFFLCSQHVPFKFPMSSHQVPNTFPTFPMCSPRVFPIAPRFNPICLAQSPPLLTYIAGPKGESLHLSIESSISGSLHNFNFFCIGPIKFAHCKKKN